MWHPIMGIVIIIVKHVQVDTTAVKYHINYSDCKIEITMFVAEWQTKSSRGSVTTNTLCKPLHEIVSNTLKLTF